jgi:uncharacterized protein (TIGR04255 family)
VPIKIKLVGHLLHTFEPERTPSVLRHYEREADWKFPSIAAKYPRWHKVLPSFESSLKNLSEILSSEKMKALDPNQWEVTYVNHFERGNDWSDPKDWQILVPGLIGRVNDLSVGSVETIGCSIHFVLPDNCGRLHVDLHHGFKGSEPDSIELLVLQLTARGGMSGAQVGKIHDLLEIGHSSIVRAFSELTGADAQKRWEREQ